MKRLVVLALVCCSKQDPTPVAIATPSATPPAASSAPAEWQAGPDVEVLAQVVAQTIAPKNVDNTGRKLKIEHYDVPGWAVATRATAKDNPAAWSVHLEGSGKAACDAGRFAPNATLMHTEGSKPLAAQWYKLAGGGPLRGLIVKAFTNDESSCSWNFATPAYAQHQGWKPPPKQP